MILWLGFFYVKTPYEFELEDDSFTIYLMTGKRKISFSDINRVKLGFITNRVDNGDKYFYVNHYVTKSSQLTRKFSSFLEPDQILKNDDLSAESVDDSSSALIYKTILIFVINFIMCVLGVLHIIRDVR